VENASRVLFLLARQLVLLYGPAKTQTGRLAGWPTDQNWPTTRARFVACNKVAHAIHLIATKMSQRAN